jgi:hypothetical protein
MKIKVGDKFLCIRDVRMEDSNRLVYIEGNVYYSESEGCITDEDGDINHYWVRIAYTKDYFKKVKD